MVKVVKRSREHAGSGDETNAQAKLAGHRTGNSPGHSLGQPD